MTPDEAAQASHAGYSACMCLNELELACQAISHCEQASAVHTLHAKAGPIFTGINSSCWRFATCLPTPVLFFNSASSKLKFTVHLLDALDDIELLQEHTCEAVKGALLAKHFPDKTVVLVLSEAVAIGSDHACTVLPAMLKHEQALIYLNAGLALSKPLLTSFLLHKSKTARRTHLKEIRQIPGLPAGYCA